MVASFPYHVSKSARRSAQQQGVRERDLPYIHQFGQEFSIPGTDKFGDRRHAVWLNRTALFAADRPTLYEHLKNCALIVAPSGTIVEVLRINSPRRNWKPV